MDLHHHGHTAALHIDGDSDEAHLARAERSLKQLDDMLESRRRWRQGLRVLAMIAVPMFLTIIVKQARLALT